MRNLKIRFKRRMLKIVDLKEYDFLVEPRYYFYGWSKLKSCYARISVVKRLLFAKKLLPEAYNFKIWDGFRTKMTQELVRKSFRRRLESLHPGWDPKKILGALNVFAGRPVKNIKECRLAGHFFGGALDLTIANRREGGLDMGTDFDDLTEKAAIDYYENKKPSNLREKIIKKNRKLLSGVMEKAGFKPYPAEWWHWSYPK